MPRPLKKTDIVLPNAVRLEALPFNKSKGRHWRATQNGETVGEFMTWQQTSYVRQPHGDYGRGGGGYTSAMVRSSWITALGESEEHPNLERLFYAWKKALRHVHHPAVKRIAS